MAFRLKLKAAKKLIPDQILIQDMLRDRETSLV